MYYQSDMGRRQIIEIRMLLFSPVIYLLHSENVQSKHMELFYVTKSQPSELEHTLPCQHMGCGEISSLAEKQQKVIWYWLCSGVCTQFS